MLGTPLRILTFGFAVLIAVPGAAFAQGAIRVGQQKQQAAAPAPAAAPAAQPQAQPPAPPQPVRTEILNFDNWSVTCREFAEGKRKRICFALLQIAQQNNNQNQVVFSWTIGTDDENHQLMTLQTPTGVSIAPGVDLKLAKGNHTVPYTACETGHCIATQPLDAALVRDIAATAEVQAIIHSSDGRDVTINIPIKGFDKAYAALPK
ncbi:invasion associated locus B family protein [Methyloferula stellata]|uniref:invasion associated locus B family protein n=1 Tax=Methyloferula stellata TaxID=876270 RepID=UPI0012682EFC|nr:invasion associated locus B family protein [Methyloferula stellata]